MAHPDSSKADNMGKPSPARRNRVVAGLRWLYAFGRFIAVCILSALLIAGLIVGAPWRINAVIGLLLANLIIVPRRLRICFDVLVGVVFIAVVVWVLSPDNDSQRWKPYTFDKELALIEAERMIPPETNAANVYRTLFSEHDSGTFDSALLRFDPYCRTLAEAWSAEEYPKVAKWLDDHERAIGMVLDAARLPQCRFSLPVTQLARDEQMLRLNVMQRWAEVVLRSINKDLGEGQNDAAIEKIFALRRMAGHLYQQQTIFDVPACLKIELLAFGAANSLVMQCDPTEKQLSGIEKPIESVGNTFADDWVNIFRNEKLFIKNIAGLFYETNDDGGIRCSHNSIPSIDAEFKMGLYLINYTRHAPRMTALFLWFVLPHHPERVGKTIDRVFDRHVGLTSDESQSGTGDKSPLRDLQLNYKSIVELAAVRSAGFFYPLSGQSLRRISCRRATRLLIALKRYHTRQGRWPDRLEELDAAGAIFIDPINNGPFAYRRIGEYFVVYSKGKNARDDGGRHNAREETDDLSIWPARGGSEGWGLDGSHEKPGP